MIFFIIPKIAEKHNTESSLIQNNTEQYPDSHEYGTKTGKGAVAPFPGWLA